MVETITRLFNIAIVGSEGMENYTLDDVIHKLRTEGELYLSDDSPIDIVVRYKPNKSCDTSYLYTLYDDLEDDGYEMICLIQDHLKRIRSTFNNSDVRLELGDVVNEFKTFAIDKDIPVITNTHLNRDAARIIEEGSNAAHKSDITRKLGKSNVGESLLMMDNIDCAIIINLEYDDEGNKYMVYSLAKMRDHTERMYIAQPFMFGSGIRMVEDVGGIPMFKETLHQNTDVPRMHNVKTSSANVMSNIGNIMNNSSTNTFSDMGYYALEEPVIDNNEEDEVTLVKPKITCPIFFFDEPQNKPSLDDLNDLKNRLQQRQQVS